MIRALIADDEALARRALVRMLQQHPDIVVIAECGDGDTALSEIERTQPNLVFLDIRMPGQTGLLVAGKLLRSFSGAIIFVTAHDRHALEAFDLNALDYLLKPFTRERLEQALDRVRKRAAQPLSNEALEQLLNSIRDREVQPRYLERIPANRNGRIHLVPAAAVERIDAMGNYARIHARGERYEIRETLQSLEKKLDPNIFLRVPPFDHHQHGIRARSPDLVSRWTPDRHEGRNAGSAQSLSGRRRRGTHRKAPRRQRDKRKVTPSEGLAFRAKGPAHTSLGRSPR